MKKNKILIWALLAGLSLVSCNEYPDMKFETDTNTNVLLMVDDFRNSSASGISDTKSSITVSSNSDGVQIHHAWSDGDKLGVFPGQGSVAQQMVFRVSAIDTLFLGSTIGWKINTGINYAAYFPFINDGNLKPDGIEFSYSGQTQNGNGYNDVNLEHLGKYDYLISDITRPKGDTTIFKLSHVGAFVRFKAIVDKGNYTSLTLSTENNDELFPGSVKLDLFGSQNVIPQAKSSSFTVGLENFHVEDTIRVWFMMPPVDLSGKKVSVVLKGDKDVTYQLNGFNIERNSNYDLCTPGNEPQKMNSFKLVLDATANGTVQGTVNGSSTMELSATAVGSTASITIPDVSVNGPTGFLGWSGTSDGEPEWKAGDGIAFSEPGTKTVYAVYEKNYFVVEYILDGGKIDSVGEYAESMFVPAASCVMKVTDRIPEKDGYEFVNWIDKEMNKEYKAGDEINLDADNNAVTLTAIWEEKQTDPYAALAVDLGLPSGTLWASCNIEEIETGENAKQGMIGTTSTYTRYYYTGTQAENDPVPDKMNTNWATPTYGQFKELIDNTTLYVYTIGSGSSKQTYYVQFTSKKDNTKKIILYSHGNGIAISSTSASKNGCYWTKTREYDSSSKKDRIYAYYWIGSSPSLTFRDFNWYGNIRPVNNKNTDWSKL